MAGQRPAAGGTEEHRAPELDAEQRGEPTLVVAFPRASTLPLPTSGQAVGRNWFEEHGLVDSKISAQHFMLTRSGGAVTVADLESRNGTWVDGQRLAPRQPARLADGALLRVGRTLLVYRDELVRSHEPAPPVGGALVGPYGLRSVGAALDAIQRRPPRCVLIEGETGTGKELVSAAVGQAVRPGRPFGAVNVAGIPAGVFESQLFGHVAGAFSGSGKGARGIVLTHDGGVVFLDEIGELPLELQPKLLRFLENGELLPVGADRPVRADVLVVAATNRPLERMVNEGTFRRDLFARLAALTIELPPLRERPEDIFAIASALAARRGEHFDPAQVDIEAVERLLLHAWPNNVRELAAVLERVAAIQPPPALKFGAVSQVLGASPVRQTTALTAERVDSVLAACGGNQSQAARELGITRGQLLRFLKAKQRG